MKERKIYTAQIRKAEDDEKMVLEGYAVVFDSPATYDGETEVIDKKAFDNCDMSDVVLRYNHYDDMFILARTRNKSLELTIDDKGLFFRAELIPTTANRDAYLMVKSGLVDKCSFAFADWKYNYDTKTKTTTIKEIGKLFDVSIVDFPYYAETSVEARGLEATHHIRDEIKANQKAEMLKRLKKENLLNRL